MPRRREWIGVFLLALSVQTTHAETPSAAASTVCSTEARLADGGSFAVAKDGTRIWYKISGLKGAPVIAYLHGGPGYNSFAFEKSAGKLLEAHFRLLYLDQRGCGRSAFDGASERYGMANTIDDIEQLRARVGVQRLILAAHSFGGVVAAAYAHQFPARVSAVIMIDTAPDLSRALGYQVSYADSIADAAWPDKAQAVHAIAASNATPIDKLSRLYEAVGRLPLQKKLHYAQSANQDRMEALDRDSALLSCTSHNVPQAFIQEGYLSEPIPAVVRRLDAPTLIIAGRQSHVVGADNIQHASEIWGARIEWIDAGHFVYFEKPQEFTAAIERFLSTAALNHRAANSG